MVKQTNLSQELSDLVVYCQPVPFEIDSELINNSLSLYFSEWYDLGYVVGTRWCGLVMVSVVCGLRRL